MEFAGERYIPSVDGQIKYEHLHRYAVCFDFIVGKSVLDIASGEGYGSALLAKLAKSVVGVDISVDTVEYASQAYQTYENLKFMVGSCESIPLPEKSIDVVVSFETIEHHDQHERMMREIKRVLKPGGMLIISSPNRLTYSDEANYSNPFHVKELYYEEFVNLLSQNFKYIKVYGQRLATGSFILPLENSEETNINNYSGNITDVKQVVRPLESPLYFIAICSDRSEVINSVISSVYIDTNDDLLKVFESNYHQTQEALQNSQMQLYQTQEALRNYESTIKDMEKSNFWKLRKALFLVKQLIFSNENKSKNQP